jgi:hypothetical protein
MATGIGLVVKINADTKKAVGDIKDVNQALDGTGVSTKKTSKFFDGLKSSAVPAVAAVAAGVGVVVASMVEFGKAAWEDHQEAQKLARILETIPGITGEMVKSNEAWITTTMFATHVLDTDLREAVGQFALVTKDLGEAQKYATAAANLATVTNTEYGTVVEAVTKALSGKTRQLMAMAPWLDTNKDGTLSLAEAQAILTSETLDGMAAAAAAEDPWTTITLIWDEIKEALGQWILPLFTRLGDWFKDPENQAKIQRFIEKIGNMSMELGQKLLPALEWLLEFMTSPEFKAAVSVMVREFQIMINIISTVVGWVMKLVEWLKTAMGWIGNVVQGVRNFDLGSPPAKGVGLGGGGAASSRSTGTAGITVNFYGGIHTDPEATARAITGSLRASERRNARARTMEPAW